MIRRTCTAILASLLLAGCGGGSSTPTLTEHQEAKVSEALFNLSTAASECLLEELENESSEVAIRPRGRDLTPNVTTLIEVARESPGARTAIKHEPGLKARETMHVVLDAAAESARNCHETEEVERLRAAAQE